MGHNSLLTSWRAVKELSTETEKKGKPNALIACKSLQKSSLRPIFQPLKTHFYGLQSDS